MSIEWFKKEYVISTTAEKDQKKQQKFKQT